MSRRVPEQRRPTREEAYAELDALYAQLDVALECKGLCADACTYIDASQLERDRIAARGVQLPPPVSHRKHLELIAVGKPQRCPGLSPLNTCKVYDVRPTICRIFGMAEGLMCEHGCIPDGIITKAQANRILVEVEELSQAVTGQRRIRATDGRPLMES